MSVWIVYYYDDAWGDQAIAGVFSDISVAQATFNTLQDMDLCPRMGEYTIDQVYPPAS